MNAKRLWQIGGLLAVLVILVVGWFLIVSPGLSSVDDNNSQRAAVQTKNAQIQRDIANLSKIDVAALKQQLAMRMAQIPGTLVEEDVFQEIKNLAASAGVTVTSIAITEPVPFVATQQSSLTAGSTATAAPTDGLAAPGLPVEPADLEATNAAGMYDSPVAISIDGGFANARTFIDLLTQQSTRTFLVTGAALNAKGGAQTISAVIWFKPRTEDLLTDPTPAPSATPTPSPSPSATPSETPSATPTSGAKG